MFYIYGVYIMAVLNKHKSGIPTGAVYIGRGSKWGNPFVMKSESMRDEVCDKYKEYLWQQIKDGKVSLSDLAALNNKDLVCFCAPKRCHGNVLESAAKWAVIKLSEKK